MKNLFLILCMVLALLSCSEDNTKQQNNSVIGTWKLVETYGSSGGQGQWTKVENGYVYSFNEDKTLISNRFTCNGVYVLDANKITIEFNCPEKVFHLTYSISYENNYLILTADPINCDEGCLEKYQRIK